MTYQVFLLYEKENEIPVFLGHKSEEEEILLTRYEKLEVFFGKQLDYLIIEKEIPEESIAQRVEDVIYETLTTKFPDVKILRYKDFIDQQKSHFLKITVLLSAINKSIKKRDLKKKKLQEEEIQALLKIYKRGFKRKFSFEQIQKLKEKFSGAGNNFWSRKHTAETKKKLGNHLKRKKKIYDKARKKIWADINAKRKGKTWDEIYGPERAQEMKDKAKKTREDKKLNSGL